MRSPIWSYILRSSATTTGSRLAMVPATSMARGRRSWWVVTSVTRPHASAVWASTKSPVRLIRRARSTPMRAGSLMVMPPPGMTPTRPWVSANEARSDAMRKSQPRASSRPPVTAGPLMAPTIGVAWPGSMPSRRTSPSQRLARVSASSVPRLRRSNPALNAGSAPVRTMAWIAGSWSSTSTASPRSTTSSAERALRFSGRFRVMTATGPRTSVTTSSLLIDVPPVLAAPAKGRTGAMVMHRSWCR